MNFDASELSVPYLTTTAKICCQDTNILSWSIPNCVAQTNPYFEKLVKLKMNFDASELSVPYSKPV